VLLEATTELAASQVPVPDTGSLAEDLRRFLAATFTAAASAAPVLRVMMAEAQRDPRAAELLDGFIAQRRAALHDLLDRARGRSELSGAAAAELIVDQAFGVLWYRMLLGRGRLDAAGGEELAAGLAQQASARRP
jgi:Tetracyclin repressor-like, C-terminal domain